MHLNEFFPWIALCPTFLHVPPAFTAAILGDKESVWMISDAIKKIELFE
jgi:hypothetical protein